jgi:4'-phosphopantetheinyl transferase EntD
MSTTASVLVIPTCSFCDKDALYDAHIPSLNTWAYVCDEHFKRYGCSVGTGRGQKLIKEVLDVNKSM